MSSQFAQFPLKSLCHSLATQRPNLSEPQMQIPGKGILFGPNLQAGGSKSTERALGGAHYSNHITTKVGGRGLFHKRCIKWNRAGCSGLGCR